ncbi:MAG: hypothetical protein [Caudovirales sp. ctOwN3]|nr:MAG: hypothetical protein [Caudovirales sp. ctOwN3]
MSSISNCLQITSDDLELACRLLRQQPERSEMQTTYIYMLHAMRTDIKHEFVELFSSMEQLEGFLFNHPKIIKQEITIHELNPD